MRELSRISRSPAAIHGGRLCKAKGKGRLACVVTDLGRRSLGVLTSRSHTTHWEPTVHRSGFFSQMALSFVRARTLRGGYKVLYNCLSWLMVLMGCVLVVALMLKSRRAFGLPMGRAPLEGIRFQFFGWILVTLTSIPLLFYVGMFLVGGAFGLIMALVGHISFADAKALALYGRPPERWTQSLN